MKKLFSRSGGDSSVTPPLACDPLLDDFPRGVEGRLKRDSWQPRNFLENPDEIALNVFEDNSRHIFLGAVHGHTIDIPRDDGRIERATLDGSLVGINDDRHLLTVAGSRSGKGRSAIIPNLLSYGGSMLVIDPKGENANCTARYRAEILGQKVYVLDPFRITRSDLRRYRKAYNPMTILNLKSPTLVEDAGLIADSLIVPGDGKDQHWDYSAKAFVESLILHVATDSEAFLPEQRHLGMVSDLLISKRKPLGDTLSDMLSNPLAGRRVLAAAQAMIDKPDDERGSIISTAQRNLKFLDYDAIRASVDDHEFDLDELQAGKTTIYLCLPAMRLGTCRGWLRLFINLLLATVERAPKKPEVPILAILDEFAVLGYMKEIEDAAGLIAGLGVKLWPILQDLGQLKSLYKNRWETFMGNTGILQAFGNVDYFTLEHLSKMLGKTTVTISNRSSQTRDQINMQGATGSGESQQVQELLTPAEIARYFARDDRYCRQLVLIPGRRPYVLSRVNYDQHPFFKNRYVR